MDPMKICLQVTIELCSEVIKELQPQHEILMTMNFIECFVKATELILFPSIHHTLKLFIVITSRVDLYEILDQSSEKTPKTNKSNALAQPKTGQ